MRAMRRVLLAVCLVALQSAPSFTAQSTPVRPQLPVAVSRLLQELQKALQRGSSDDLRALASATLPAEDADRLARTVAGGPVTNASVRDRAWRPAENGYEVLADVLISRERTGRIATWVIAVRPRGPTPE